MTLRVTIPLRLAPELHARLKELAEKDQRSLNAFIALSLSRVVARSAPVAAESVATAVPLKNAYESGARTRKARPNDPCPCGSGTKYKRCHGHA
jgi:uncharacterized protein YecA (UPF0149 family)